MDKLYSSKVCIAVTRVVGTPNRERTTAITSFDSRWDPQEMLKMWHEEIVVKSNLFTLFFSFGHMLFSNVQFLRTVNYKIIVYLYSKGKHS